MPTSYVWLFYLPLQEPSLRSDQFFEKLLGLLRQGLLYLCLKVVVKIVGVLSHPLFISKKGERGTTGEMSLKLYYTDF